MDENINEKIAELEEKRLAAYKKNQEIRKKIQELQDESTNLYKDEFKYQEEITKLKSDEASLYLGKFVKANNCYLYVTSIANEYKNSLHQSCTKKCPGAYSLHVYQHTIVYTGRRRAPLSKKVICSFLRDCEIENQCQTKRAQIILQNT